MDAYQYGDVRYGILYEDILRGSLTFNSSYNALLSKGYRLYGAGNVSYILIPSDDGGFDGIILSSGSYQDFYGDHTKNGLKGGAIKEAGFYKNAKVIDYGDGTYDIQDFEYSANLIASIPLRGMTVDQFLAALATRGNTYSPLNLFKELLKSDNWVSGDNQGESTVVDGFDGNDEFYISSSAQFARGGAGNDLFQGTPTGAAILDGGLGDDTFDGSSGSSDRSKQYLWVGGKGENLYRGPNLNTIVVIDQKTSGQSPDIITYGDLLLTRQNQKTGYVVIKTSSPDVNQLDLRFVDQPLLDSTGKQVAESGYFSVLYKGVEQVKINPMSGGWSLDGFIAEKDTYENTIRAAIAVASMEQLIVSSNYSETALQEIKKEYSLTTISDKVSVDLRGQTLLDKSSYLPIADRFYLTDIKQNSATGQLELIFNQTVGTIGSTTIVELDSAGKPIRYAYFGPQKKDGNKIITSISNTGDKKYLAVLTNGWTNQSGISLEGQGTYGSSGAQSYQFTFGKDMVKPTVTSVTTNGTNEITVIFSENIEFANLSPGAQIGYLSRKQSPTSLADLAYTFTVKDATIKGSTLTLRIDKTLDGDLYFLPLQIKDPTGNYYSGSWMKDAKLLSFEDPVAADNRVKINRSEDNSFIIPISVFWKNAANRNSSDGSSISFSWKKDGSISWRDSFSDSFYAFQDYGQYVYALKDSGSAFHVTIGDFAAEGIHKLSSVTIYHGNGEQDRYETPEAINQLLNEWELPAGSLDIEVIGEGVSFIPTLTSLSIDQTLINIGDFQSSVFGSVKWTNQSNNSYYSAATRLSSLNLEYAPSQGYGQNLTVYLSSWDSELVSDSTNAVFRIDPGELYSGLKSGIYQLKGARAEWSSPAYFQQEYSAAQLIDLGLPASLTLEGSRTESSPQPRRLLDFSIDSPVVKLEGSDTYRFVQAKVEVDDFNPQLQSYLEERVSLSFTNSEFQNAVQASGDYGSTLYKTWDPYLNTNLYPTAYAFDSSSGKATIGFEGWISVSKSQYAGDYTLSSCSLQGAYYRNNGNGAATYLSKEELLNLNSGKINITGGRQKGLESVISLTDVDPILTQVPAYDSHPYRVTLNSSKPESQVSLNIYLSHTSPSSTAPNTTNLLNSFYKDLLFPDLPDNSVLFGWFGLESPSGFQTKIVPITVADEVDLEQYWSNSHPSVHKYAPIVTFNKNDESGDWRLTSLYLTNPSTGSLFQENLSNLISANSTDYRDGSPSVMSTEAIASRLGIEPSGLVVTVDNPLFDESSLGANFQVNPQITNLKISFQARSVDAGDSQRLRLALDSDYAFGDASKTQFYAIRLLLSHDKEHVFSLQNSDIYVNVTSRDIVSEVEISPGQYKTIFDLEFDVPSTQYSGQYTLRNVYLIRDYGASSLFLNPQFERYDQVDEGRSHTSIIGVNDNRSASGAISGVDIVPSISTADRDFLQYQLDRFELTQSVDDLSFTIDGKQVDEAFLNPRSIDYRIKFLDKNLSVRLGTATRVRFEVSSDFEDRYRSYSSSLTTWEFVNRSASGLSLVLTSQTTGESIFQQARYVGASSSPGQSVYEIYLDSSIASGTHRITSLGTTLNFRSGIEADSLKDGISAAEAVLLDKIFGEGSTVSITNGSRTLPSVSLRDLSFSAASLKRQVNNPTVVTTVQDAPGLELVADSGFSQRDRITNNSNINVLGIARGIKWQFSIDHGKSWKIGTGISFNVTDGSYNAGQVRVRQQDASGKFSEINSTFAAFTVDTKAPKASGLKLAADTGSSKSDRITNNKTINVSAIESGATWQFSTDYGKSWTLGSETSFTVKPGSYKAGQVRARQIDKAGNISEINSTFAAFTVDTTAPKLLISSAGVRNRINGSASGLLIKAKGAEPNQRVDLNANNGRLIARLNANRNGQVYFSLTPEQISLIGQGRRQLQLQQSDRAGNIGRASQSVTVDTTIASSLRDSLTGTSLKPDTFLFSNIGQSRLANYDTITSYESRDRIVVSGHQYQSRISKLANGRQVRRLNQTEINKTLEGRRFQPRTAVAFEASGFDGTFIVLNDSRAGFQANSDMLVLLEGFNVSKDNHIHVA